MYAESQSNHSLKKFVGVAGSNSALSPQPAQTKITGKANIGFIRDQKKAPVQQRVKATTASIPMVCDMPSNLPHKSDSPHNDIQVTG